MSTSLNLRFNLFGGGGKDTITAAFQANGGFSAPGGGGRFGLFIDGGSGDDSITAGILNSGTGTVVYTVVILGNTGNDEVTFTTQDGAGATPPLIVGRWKSSWNSSSGSTA